MPVPGTGSVSYRQAGRECFLWHAPHPVKYCPRDKNPVGDHDLLEGEGVGVNELTLLKFKMDPIWWTREKACLSIWDLFLYNIN